MTTPTYLYCHNSAQESPQRSGQITRLLYARSWNSERGVCCSSSAFRGDSGRQIDSQGVGDSLYNKGVHTHLCVSAWTHTHTLRVSGSQAKYSKVTQFGPSFESADIPVEWATETSAGRFMRTPSTTLKRMTLLSLSANLNPISWQSFPF